MLFRSPTTILIPDSAHGTNPASCTLCGYKVKTIKSNSKGKIELDDLRKNVSEDVAGLMITNPNTLGLYEEKIAQITQIIHEVDGLVYMDGANMNALLGIAKPGDFGIDVMHYNLHKTFSTPHGGGGPGSGPIAVGENLKDFLPSPIVEKNDEGKFYCADMPKSIGKTRSFLGNTGVIVRAYSYIRKMGKKGIANIGKLAVLNANYLLHKLKPLYEVPYGDSCMHECVISATDYHKNFGVRAMDIAKRLLDMNYHAPTVYFPLIVPEALMIEPTETENKETLDNFAKAMEKISQEAKEEPWKLQEAQFMTPMLRLDEVKAARNPIVKYDFEK